MTKEYDFYCKSKNEDVIRKDWFPNHIIERDEGWSDEWVLWREPGTGIFMVCYHLYRNKLFVTGDIGSAVYVWSQNVSWDFLANCSIDYFKGKCEASEYGRFPEVWDGDEAEKQIKYTVKDRIESGIIEEGSFGEELYEEALNCCHCEHDWHSFLGSSEGEKLFGCDWDYANIGMTIPIRTEGHLVGLKMMKEQRDQS